mmetsp:Transcript_47307/g.143835  ORF Transcript_47307/g.143835 Transcript_47307/m.143835 type:complete len:348 (+) Transcript_47307:1010-2053(+)
MLVYPLEAGRLVKRPATLGSVLPAVEDGIAFFLLENALVASLRQLWSEPVVIGVLLDLLQRDDVCSHGLQLFQDQVLPPCPRQRPLFAIRVDRLRRVEVRQNIPIHHLELLAQPLCVESPAVANHAACPRFLGRGDDGAGGDRHPPDGRIFAVLEQGDDVKAQRPVDILLTRAIRPRRTDLYPLGDRLLYLVVRGLAPPHVLRQIVPAPKEALLGAKTLKRFRDVPDLGHLVRVEKARLDDRAAKPAVTDARATALVLEEPAVLVPQRYVNRHLRHDDRTVAADQLCSHHCDRWLFVVVAPSSRSAPCRTPGIGTAPLRGCHGVVVPWGWTHGAPAGAPTPHRALDA